MDPTGPQQRSLYRWQRQSAASQTRKEPAPFSISYHEKQADVNKWIKNVDAAADKAVKKHLGRGTSTSHGAENLLPPRSACTGPSLCEEQDAIAEANQLLASYMANSGNPLAEVHLLDSDPMMMDYQPSHHHDYHHASVTTIPLEDALDPLGEAQFVLNTIDGLPSLEVPHTSSALDAFVPLAAQVQHEVGSMLSHLMDVPIASVTTPRAVDPQLQMDARHMQLKERSHKRLVKNSRKKEAKQIQHDAEKLLEEQTHQSEAKRKLEDMLLHVEVKKLRKQVKVEKEELERRMKDIVEVKSQGRSSKGARTQLPEPAGARGDSSPPPRTSASLLTVKPGKSKTATHLLTGGKRPEDTLAAKRQATRRVLEVQLRQAEEQEHREQLMYLRTVFTSWYGLVLERRQCFHRACATLNWRQTFRLWTHWQAMVRGQRVKREEEEVARVAIREKRLEHAAGRLNEKFVMRRCLWAWKRYMKQAKFLGEVVQGAETHADDGSAAQKRMESLMQAVTSGALASKIQKEEDEQYSRKQEDKLPLKKPVSVSAKEGTVKRSERSAPESQHTQPGKRTTVAASAAPSLITTHTAARYLEQQAVQKSHKQSTVTAASAIYASGNERPIPPTTSTPGVTSKMRAPAVQKQRCKQEMKFTDTPASMSKQSNSGITGMPTMQKPRPNVSIAAPSTKSTFPTHTLAHDRDPNPDKANPGTLGKPQPQYQDQQQSAKKSAVLSAMAERTAAIAARKHQRAQRQKEAEQRRLVELRRIEEENRAAEEAEKKAALEKRRDERRKLKEAEHRKEETLRKQQQLVQKANSCHQLSLVKFYGFRPWKRFLANVKQQHSLAERHCDERRVRCHFHEWFRRWQEKENERQQLADDLHRHQVLRSHLQYWLKEVYASRANLAMAVDHDNSKSVGVSFLAWKNYCRELKREEWEKGRKAFVHYNRLVKQRYLRLWRQFVPLQKEEAEQEKRRKLLRARVSQLLPDYNPCLENELEDDI